MSEKHMGRRLRAADMLSTDHSSNARQILDVVNETYEEVRDRTAATLYAHEHQKVSADLSNEVIESFLQHAGISTRNDDEETVTDLSTDDLKREIAGFLMVKGADIMDELRSKSPWIQAAERGDEAEMMLLLEAGIDINLKGEGGRTALWWAAYKSYEKIAQLLVKRGANIEARDDEDGKTPLMLAVSNKDESLMALLLDNGASIEERDNQQRTPLWYAAHCGFEIGARLLVTQKAEIDAQDTYGETPLHIAAEKGHAAVATILLQSGANLGVQNRSQMQPIMSAAAKSHVALVRMLLERGAEVNVRNIASRTCLLLAVEDSSHWRRELWVTKALPLIELLLENGAEIDAHDMWGTTALVQAARKGNGELVRLLLDKRANVEGVGEEGSLENTPLLAALSNEDNPLEQSEHVAIVVMLLDRGAQFESKDERGRTALSLLSGVGKKSDALASLFLERGANVNVSDGRGETALSKAVENGNESRVRLLLQKGANANICGESKGTQTSDTVTVSSSVWIREYREVTTGRLGRD